LTNFTGRNLNYETHFRENQKLNIHLHYYAGDRVRTPVISLIHLKVEFQTIKLLDQKKKILLHPFLFKCSKMLNLAFLFNCPFDVLRV
jgi:hypothetical protein